MDWTSLAWQLPALFTAVPLVHRLLPFKLPERAIPLFYLIIGLIVLNLPVKICLALGMAGLMSLFHNRIGIRLSDDPGPDMAESWNKVVLAWDHVVSYLQTLPVSRVKPVRKASLHDSPEDDNLTYSEPPPAPVRRRIPHLG